MSSSGDRSTRPPSLWRNRDFTLLWSVETLSQAGAQVSVLALPLTAVIVLGAGAAEVGILAALQYVPVVLVTLFAGVWLDRHRRRPALIITNAARFVLLASIPLLHVTGGLSLPVLYALTLAAGFMTAVADVAYLVYLPSLVRDDQLIEANSKLEATYSVALIGGPGLGGALVQTVGAPLTILADALSYLAAALGVTAIKRPEPAPRTSGTRLDVRGEILTGLRTILGHPVLRALIGMAALFNLFEQIVMTLYVLFALKNLGLSPAVMGLVLGLGSVGGLLGALAAERLVGLLRAGRSTLLAVLLAALGLVLVPVADGGPWAAIPVLITAFVIYGFGLGAFNVVSLSLRATIVPSALLGRVTASFRLLVYGTVPVGALVGGALGDLIGVGAAVTVGALGLLVVACLFWATSLRHVDMDVEKLPEEPAPATERNE